MNQDLLELLLHEDEGVVLDFKSQQYPFANASNEQKSELLKDILGFANGWRRDQTAYILIGVEEIRGGRSRVVGVDEHLDDHSLQQFVNSKTNKPLSFSYQVCQIDNCEVGVITIDPQERPLYINRDYGKLTANLVYMRRGSSIDISRPASPDEIAKMRISQNVVRAPEIRIQFVEEMSDEIIGDRLSVLSEVCEITGENDLPNLRIDLGIQRGLMLKPNLNFYREFASFERFRRASHSFRLRVENCAEVATESSLIEVDFPKEAEVFVEKNRPCLPSTTLPITPAMEHLRSLVTGHEYAGKVDMVPGENRLSICVGTLQPGRSIFTDSITLRIESAGEHEIVANVYANNLREPLEIVLILAAEVEKGQLSKEELFQLADRAADD